MGAETVRTMGDFLDVMRAYRDKLLQDAHSRTLEGKEEMGDFCGDSSSEYDLSQRSTCDIYPRTNVIFHFILQHVELSDICRVAGYTLQHEEKHISTFVERNGFHIKGDPSLFHDLLAMAIRKYEAKKTSANNIPLSASGGENEWHGEFIKMVRDSLLELWVHVQQNWLDYYVEGSEDVLKCTEIIMDPENFAVL